MEIALRVIAYVAVGLGLLALNLWYVIRVKEAIYGSNVPRVIAPFKIIGKTDDGKLGTVMAYMLRARLSKIRDEMASSSRSLEEARSLKLTTPVNDPIVPAQRADINSLEKDIPLPDEIFTPLNLNMSVSGVEVGGILSWLHRWLTEDQALIVSVSYNGDKAVASGNISTTGAGILWVETVGNDDVEMIADVAYAITQKRFAERYEQVNALTPKEFRTLLTSLHKTAELNQQAALGRASGKPYEALLGELENLIKQVPNWQTLTRLTAATAERANLLEKALTYYKAELTLNSDALSAADREFLDGKINQLTKLIEEKNAAEAALTDPGTAENVSGTVVGAIRSAVGVSSVDMSGTTTIAIIGPPPLKTTLPQNQMSVVGPEPQDTGRGAQQLSQYVDTLVQSIQLVAPKTRFMFIPIKALELGTFQAEILAALNRVLSLENKPNILLVPYSGLEEVNPDALFQQLSLKGVTIIISAGNNPAKAIPFARSSVLDQLMVVSAVDVNGRRLPFAPDDPKVFWAPGDRIPVKIDGRLQFQAGTGYSAAIAAGVAARVLEQHKDPTKLVELLRASSQKRSNDGPSVINLAKALEVKITN